jgi:serine/threonine-protein kinase GIN4
MWKFLAPPPEPTPRLSQVLDRNLFIAPLLTSRDDLLDSKSMSSEQVRETSLDDLTSSPYHHVEPYPQRIRGSQDPPLPDTPTRHRIEGVYDRFLMATSGVKRLGKGYQSDNAGPVCGNIVVPVSLNKSRHFYSARKPMPPPVSSEDQPRVTSMDELGASPSEENHLDASNSKDDGNTTVALVRKAIKLMVPKATGSRRMSRIG